MPKVSFDLPISTIADIINSMNGSERETLCLLLYPEGKELLERKKDLEQNRVRFLTRDEVFNV